MVASLICEFGVLVHFDGVFGLWIMVAFGWLGYGFCGLHVVIVLGLIWCLLVIGLVLMFNCLVVLCLCSSVLWWIGWVCCVVYTVVI